MKFITFLLFLSISHSSYSSDVSDYLQKYRVTGLSNYSLEQGIIRNNDLEKLLEKLTPFYNDTVINVRQKAYYLTWKRAIRSDSNRILATTILLKGCNDRDGGVVGQNLDFLKSFHLKDFNDESVQLINLNLVNHRIQHYKDFVLLAGFIGAGKDILYQKLLDQSVSPKSKWYISLALARTGNAEQINYCMEKVRKLPLNDNLLDYIVPELIYMRQKESIDFCINILNSNEKLCHSLNPDLSESIICGYRVIEVLASVVVDIPATLDDSGFLKTSSYEKMLDDVRRWFEQNPNYQVRKNIY